MSANQNSHPTEILNDLDLSLDRLRGACVALELIGEHSGLNDTSDTTAAFYTLTSAAKANVIEAMGFSDQLHSMAVQIGGDV